MTERQDFLKRLAGDEDDQMVRSIYADWLEEQGDYDEANRQRQWPEAKKWMVDFARRCSHHYGGDEEDDDRVTVKQLLDWGGQAAKQYEQGNEDSDGSFFVQIGHYEWVADELRDAGEEFWEKWSILTGKPLPPGMGDRVYYGCSC